MTTVTGTVKAKSTNKFGYGIMVNDKWYNSKEAIPCNKGDEVEFDDGGKAYVRSLKVTKATDTSAVSSSSPVASKGSTGASFNRGVFPIPANDGSRSIVRQNSLTNALKYAECFFPKLGTGERADSYVWAIIDIARQFEKYSSGDIDTEVSKTIDETFTVS